MGLLSTKCPYCGSEDTEKTNLAEVVGSKILGTALRAGASALLGSVGINYSTRAMGKLDGEKEKWKYICHHCNCTWVDGEENSVRSYASLGSISLRVKAIIVEKLGVDEAEVTETASFTNDLGADSLDIVELIMRFEQEFGITIPDDQAEKIACVGDAIAFIEWSASFCSISSRVKTLVVDKLGVDFAEVTDQASFLDDLGAYESDIKDLIMQFEQEFGVTIPDNQAEKITTVGQAIAIIEQNAR